MAIQPKQQISRLLQRIDVLERRNAVLRAEVERLTHGEQPVWTPFEEANVGVFGDGRTVNISGGCRQYLNSRYQVTLFSPTGHEVVHISYKRIDGAACRDWRDGQRIKNELLGPEWEAVELYPAESRCVDGANQYHLFCIPAQFPFGFNERLVTEDQSGGCTQRPFPDEIKPPDLQSVSIKRLADFAGLGE